MSELPVPRTTPLLDHHRPATAPDGVETCAPKEIAFLACITPVAVTNTVGFVQLLWQPAARFLA